MSLALTGAAWILPVEIVQAWATGRVGKDDFSQFEAFEASAASLWFARIALTTSLLLLSIAWTTRRRLIPFLAKTVIELWQATGPQTDPSQSKVPSAVVAARSILIRGFLAAWALLAIYHAGFSIHRRLWDWPVYRLDAGQVVLPNISETNRELIRYLEAATPPGSRILVLSDQKLFFLSYYLLPRRLFHPTHPDSEFVIAQPYNERQLAAYRLSDLSADRIAELRPDYILEYFEGAAYIQGENLVRDTAWVDFQRRRRGPAWRPGYLVALRRYAAGETP